MQSLKSKNKLHNIGFNHAAAKRVYLNDKFPFKVFSQQSNALNGSIVWQRVGAGGEGGASLQRKRQEEALTSTVTRPFCHDKKELSPSVTSISSQHYDQLFLYIRQCMLQRCRLCHGRLQLLFCLLPVRHLFHARLYTVTRLNCDHATTRGLTGSFVCINNGNFGFAIDPVVRNQSKCYQKK